MADVSFFSDTSWTFVVNVAPPGFSIIAADLQTITEVLDRIGGELNPDHATIG